MPEKLLITIDGPAGVGKTTLAQKVAQAMGIAYLDTGAMFRTTALRLGDRAWTLPAQELESRLAGLRFELTGSGAGSVLMCGERPVGQEVRTEQAGMWASNMAARPEVRDFQKAAQRAIGERTSLVAEGRDMGTVVFPKASRKFFLDADPAIRAERRAEQLRAMGQEADVSAIEKAIRIRDHQDRNRAVAPLVPAADAVVIDTSRMSLEQVFQQIMADLKTS